MDTYYEVFDINAPLLETSPYFKCDNGKKAVEEYLKGKGTKFNSIVRDGNTYARFCATPFYFIEGVKYRLPRKRKCWYSIK